MQELLSNFLSANFIPHGHCYLWKPGLVWLHVLSDVGIALAYYSIPLMLVYFVRQRRDVPFSGIFLLFGAFIILCGSGHMMEVWTLWQPHYWIAGVLKAATALVSLYTASMMVGLIPAALALPNPAVLEATNRQLEEEIRSRATAEEQLRQTTAELQAIFQALPDLYFRLTADGTILNYHAGLSADLYLPASEFLGKPIREVMPAEVSDRIGKAILQVFQQSYQETPISPVQIEYCLLMPDGEKSYEARLMPLLENQVIAVVRDITPAKQAEAALRASEERFRRIFADAPIGIALGRLDTYKVCEMNRAFCKMLGYDESELIEKTFVEITHPEDIEKDVNLARKVGAGELPCYQIEKRYLKKNREIVWANLTATLIRDSEGVLYSLGMIEDISDRKRAEEALSASQQMLRLVIDNIPQYIFWKDRNSVYLGCNQNFARLAGVGSAENIVGLTDCDLAWKNQEADFYCECERRVMETDTPAYHIIETRMQESGKLSWIDTNKIPLHDASGKVVGMLGTYEDITERKTAEEALIASEQRFQKLAANVPGVIYRASIRPDGVASMLYASAGCRELCELEPEELQKSCGYDLIHPDDRQSLKKSIVACNNTLKPWNWQGRIVTPSGQLKWVQAAARIEKQSNGEIIWDGLVIDITARKQAEEQVRFQARLLDAVEQAAIATDIDGKIIYWNRFAETLFGWDSAEALGQNIVEIIAPEMSQNQAIELMSRLSVGESWSGEFLVKRRDGTAFPVMATDSPIYDSKGTLIGIVGVSQDISERKQAEEALRLSEAQYKALAGQEELLNRLASQIRNSLDLDTILETAVQEIRNLLKIDRCLFVWYRYEERKREEERINSEVVTVNYPYWEVVKEAKNEDMPGFVGRFSAEKDQSIANALLNLEILRVDDMAIATEPELLNMHVALGYTALLAFPIQTRSGELGLVSCGHFSGRRYWSDSEVELLSAVCDQLAIAISQAEIYAQARETARLAQAQAQQIEQALYQLQQTQAQLIQSEKMSSLGQLVAGVAHEINNPVNFIHGNLKHATDYASELLHLVHLYQQQYPQPGKEIQEALESIDLDFLKEDFTKLLASMKMGTERIRQIVLSLRNFSRLDEAQMKPVDIHEGIDSSLLILQHRLQLEKAGESAEIRVIKEYGNLPSVECYPQQLNQVFMNILANAIDVLEMEHGLGGIGHPEEEQSRKLHAISRIPTIRIRTEAIAGDKVAITIADNGLGIPEEIRQRIFDPFFTTKPVGSGTGLGLSISYQIVVEKHGGNLRCISEPGMGALFAIEIPIRQSANLALPKYALS